MRWSLGAGIAVAAAIGCGSNGGKSASDGGADSGSGESAAADDAARDGAVGDSGSPDSGDGGNKKMLPADGASGGPFACGAETCDPATQYCEHANSNIAGGGASDECVSFDGGCSPPSCACLGLQPTASSPGQCGCYESGGEVTYGFCPP